MGQNLCTAKKPRPIPPLLRAATGKDDIHSRPSSLDTVVNPSPHPTATTTAVPAPPTHMKAPDAKRSKMINPKSAVPSLFEIARESFTQTANPIQTGQNEAQPETAMEPLVTAPNLSVEPTAATALTAMEPTATPVTRGPKFTRPRTPEAALGPAIQAELIKNQVTVVKQDKPEEAAPISFIEFCQTFPTFHGQGRWTITSTMMETETCSMYEAKDEKTGTHGFLRIFVKDKWINEETNEWYSWESFETCLFTKVFRAKKDAQIIRVLDFGELAHPNQKDDHVEFMVLERTTVPLEEWLNESDLLTRQIKVLDIAIGLLKGLYDLHEMGIIHRNLHPGNIALYSKDQPAIFICELSDARFYTDGKGIVRHPRTTAKCKGETQWASGHELKGRHSGPYDDLIRWMYLVVSMMVEDRASVLAVPWNHQKIPKHLQILKSTFVQPRLLLRDCPLPFYPIYSYLMTASRLKLPSYQFLADKIKESKELLEEKQQEQRKKAEAAAKGTTNGTTTGMAGTPK